MSIYYLREQDFEVQQGHLCCNNVKDLTLVFYSSPDCPNCGPIMPIIQQLSRTVQGCGFGVVNIKQNYNLSLKSRQTSTPITYVPYTILYHKGVPYQQFKNTYTLENLQKFIVNAANQIKAKGQGQGQGQQQSNSTQPIPPAEKAVPPYTIGVPYCDEESGVCYLNFDKAYQAKS